jgi:hypothetical protein
MRAFFGWCTPMIASEDKTYEVSVPRQVWKGLSAEKATEVTGLLLRAGVRWMVLDGDGPGIPAPPPEEPQPPVREKGTEEPPELDEVEPEAAEETTYACRKGCPKTSLSEHGRAVHEGRAHPGT